MKRKILIIIGLILIISIIFFIIQRENNAGAGDEKSSPISISYDEIEEMEEENDKIDSEEENEAEAEKEKVLKIIEEQGLKGNENIYELSTEYDGREIVAIKSSITFKVVLSGILKNSKPEFSEIDQLLTTAPNHTGIWISENSRNEFLELIKSITNANYTIDSDGYLVQEEKFGMNKYDRKIKKMIESKLLIALDINSICYLVDEVTGEIQEYPFEEIDPEDECQYFKDGNKEVYILSSNRSGEIDQKETLKQILSFFGDGD